MDKQLTIAFDFDGTISEDPKGFLAVMDFLKVRGHNVIVVTGRMRSTDPEDLNFLMDNEYKVYFTDHKAKRKYMRGLGIDVDIWVDDLPEAMIQDWNGPPRTFREGKVVVADAA